VRVLISPHAVLTHLQPMVPLGWALRAAGHDVLVAMPQNLCAEAGMTGLNTVAVGPDFDDVQFLRDRLPGDALPIDVWHRPDEDFWGIVGVSHTRMMRLMIDEYLEVVRWWRPHLIVTDPMLLAGRIAGGVLDIPVVVHRWGIDPFTQGFARWTRRQSAPDCRRLGLTELPDANLVLDPCPPSLQLPGIPAGRPLRYEPYNALGSMPRWAQVPPGRPRVVVSMGTHMPGLNGHVLVDRMVRALAGLDGVDVVLAVPRCEPELLAMLGDRVVHVGPVPLNLILPGCAAVAFHGGTGTAMTASRLGVPQLVLPQYADQFPYADRLNAVGNGIAIDTPEGQRDIGVIRDAFRTLVEAPGPRAGADRIAAESAAMIPPAAMVSELEQLAHAGVAR
jgi:UDP:flavonoid glycosyltransferase YjiC (YdhE family)